MRKQSAAFYSVGGIATQLDGIIIGGGSGSVGGGFDIASASLNSASFLGVSFDQNTINHDALVSVSAQSTATICAQNGFS